jgi:hypothetical protein
LPGKRIARLLADLFEEAGIRVIERSGQMVAVGVSVKEPGDMMTVGRA